MAKMQILLRKGHRKKSVYKSVFFFHMIITIYEFMETSGFTKKIDLMFGGPGTTGTTTHSLKSTATTG